MLLQLLKDLPAYAIELVIFFIFELRKYATRIQYL